MDGPVQTRQLLRPWLIDQINSGLYPGLEWIDKTKLVFKIPWKHFGRPGFDEYKDGMLFRNYAIHTNKFKVGDEADISAMKTRFRCAMHKHPEVEEMHSLSQAAGDDPYKVYRFKAREETRDLSAPKKFVEYASCAPEATFQDIGDGFGEYEDAGTDILDDLFDDDSKSLVTSQIGAVGDNDDVTQSLWTTDGMRALEVSSQEDTKPFLKIDCSPLHIRLYFGEKEVGEQTVTNPWGVRVAFKPPPPMPEDVLREETSQVVADIFGPLHADQVYFPFAADPSIFAILDCMKRGLVLQVRNGEIWATRLCRAKVFYADTVSSDGEIKELKRQLTTKVFDYSSDFLPALHMYVLGQRSAPASDVYFSFGQRWSSLSLLKTNFVYASVTHMVAQQNLKDVHRQRLDSILVSDPNCLDVIASQIEDLNLNRHINVSLQASSFNQAYK